MLTPLRPRPCVGVFSSGLTEGRERARLGMDTAGLHSQSCPVSLTM